jgi:hypothetical protein
VISGAALGLAAALPGTALGDAPKTEVAI